ncbi:rab-protein geranylgeranyltransferase [Epithele typhae]|uniref:rab-protein geranylgeranyltransferase n=1 Tax=Epithele typhae TaxID=378194 RepID=UPI002007D50F|nr:rab-protein geranylgeranyltransferase [Epithele typhae]KAH9946233.1 rab-protein geranylgeranyltransferase [Epithele typhae]
MHGFKRVKYTREALAAKKEREQAKLKQFQDLTAEVLAKKKIGDYSKDAFELTTKLLQVNPEFYTIWNYRRTILLKGIFQDSPPTQVNDILSDDLSLTTAFLKQHPKVYWIWNHRQWCLRMVPDGPTDEKPYEWRQSYWTKELFVAEKMLEADSRNFMAWNYRRTILESMPVKKPETADLAFTKRKIEANFSNFSAWHQRTKVLTSLWDAGKLDKKKSVEDEFDLVKNAMYTDPNDQSVWIYHRWLIGAGDNISIVEREIEAIQELLEEQPDSKWCMESLVYYKRLLLRAHEDTMDSGERQSLSQACNDLLSRLQTIDPDRRQRYVDIGESYPSFFRLRRILNAKHATGRQN